MHVLRGDLQAMPPGCPGRHSGIPFPVNCCDVPALWGVLAHEIKVDVPIDQAQEKVLRPWSSIRK